MALDGAGRVAAATSTGGLFAALPGRVGDSALIGYGQRRTGYARNSAHMPVCRVNGSGGVRVDS